MENLWDISWIHLVILILASFRLTHLIVYDEITSFLRAPFLQEFYESDERGELVHRLEIKGTGLRHWTGSLLSCHWCVGVWSSACIVLLYWLLPAVYPLILLLAIAGGAAILATKV